VGTSAEGRCRSKSALCCRTSADWRVSGLTLLRAASRVKAQRRIDLQVRLLAGRGDTAHG
jgi:hypothetical protein